MVAAVVAMSARDIEKQHEMEALSSAARLLLSSTLLHCVSCFAYPSQVLHLAASPFLYSQGALFLMPVYDCLAASRARERRVSDSAHVRRQSMNGPGESRSSEAKGRCRSDLFYFTMLFRFVSQYVTVIFWTESPIRFMETIYVSCLARLLHIRLH